MRITKVLAAAVFALALTSVSGFAANQFQGTWKVEDTKGNPFEIMLNEDGTAKGNRDGEGLNGTWKAQGDSAMISWDSGWTTKITKDGSKYKKVAYEKGKAATDGHSSEAQKVQ